MVTHAGQWNSGHQISSRCFHRGKLNNKNLLEAAESFGSPEPLTGDRAKHSSPLPRMLPLDAVAMERPRAESRVLDYLHLFA